MLIVAISKNITFIIRIFRKLSVYTIFGLLFYNEYEFSECANRKDEKNTLIVWKAINIDYEVKIREIPIKGA